jgi:hypothetical protein
MRKYQKKHIKMLSKTLAKYIFTVRKTKAFISLKDDDTYIEASVMLSGQYSMYRCFKKLKLFIYHEKDHPEFPGFLRAGCCNIVDKNGKSAIGLNYIILTTKSEKYIRTVIRHELGHIYEYVYNDDISEESANKYE